VIPVQLFGNYHFVLKSNTKIDPFVGLALVYSHYSSSWSGPYAGSGGASASTTTLAGQGGARYFLSDRLALQGQVGFGYGTLGIGAAWKL
jgi:outer membrane protein W